MKYVVATVLTLLTITPAWSIDFTVPLLNEDGKPYERCVGPPKPDSKDGCEKEPITLGSFIFDALNGIDSSVKPTEIVSRGILALKLKTATDLSLDDTQRDLTKTALLAAYSNPKLAYLPVAIVHALKIIDPAAVNK